MNKFRLWLLAHGLEIEFGHETEMPSKGGIRKMLLIALNHRYVGLDVIVIVKPFSGVFDDELTTPHAEIAAQYEQDAE